MQRVTPDIGEAFGPVDTDFRDTFVLALFQGLIEGTPGRGVTCLPVKQAGLALTDPTKTAPKNWTESCVITEHLVVALREKEEFRIRPCRLHERGEGRGEEEDLILVR